MIKKDVEHKLIKYDIDELLSDDEIRKPNWFYNTYKCVGCCCGSSGAGKTSFLINQILNGVFDISILILYLPEETLNSGVYRNLIKRNILNKKILVSNLSKENDLIEEVNDNVIIYNKFLTFKDILEIRTQYIKSTKDKRPFLLIFDDFISLFDKHKWQEFHEFLFNSSRLNSYMFALVQSFKDIIPTLRVNFSIIILFVNYLSSSVVKTILNNSIPLDLSKKNIDDLIYYIKQQPNRHEPLILVNGVEKDKKIIYDNQYITFD